MKPNELCLTPTRGVSNLEFALLWMPRARRRDALLFYRFCRTIDDIADEDGRTPEEKEDLLGEWLKAVETGLPNDLEQLLERHGIDRRLLAEIVEGCASDIRPRLFETVSDLEDYCWKVACAVGLVSIRIFGCVDPLSAAYATHLGHGLQLTNILRDVGEDAARGRIYLPLEDLRRNGVDPADVLARAPCKGLQAVMSKVAARARARFAAAQVPAADFSALLPARIMRAIYEKTLSRIAIEDFPILPRRHSLGTLQKLACAATVFMARPGSATGT
jgi:phytoene synthase